MSAVSVVGSVAFDTIETPMGRAERVLGGAATHFAVAASYFAPVHLIAVVGDDFPATERDYLASRGIDLAKPIYLSTYGERTKKEGLAVVHVAKPGATSLVWDDARFNFTRARNAEVWIHTRQTVKDFPDYWVTTGGFSMPPKRAAPFCCSTKPMHCSGNEVKSKTVMIDTPILK